MSEITKKIRDRVDQLLTTWMTEDGTYYVDIESPDGSITSMKPSNKPGTDFVGWLTHLCASEFDHDIKTDLINTTFSRICHRVKTEGNIRKTAVRNGGSDKEVIVDLCDSLGRFVKITPGTIETVLQNPSDIKFIKSKGSGVLPKPNVDSNTLLTTWLKKYIDTNDNDICLLASWIVGCMKPKGPYPILILTGEQGSGKSTTARMLRRLVDPHVFDLREPFEDRRDLVAAVKNSFILAFDNVSILKFWLSDQLCRISTGTGTLGGRTLYTDTEETAIMACRPIILNGIPDFAERGDLLDRAIQIQLPTIRPSKRRDDDEYWRLFEADYAEITGAIYRATQAALSNFSSVKLDEKPRMSAFATWIVAAEPTLGWRKGLFLEAYKSNREIAEANLLEFNSLASSVMRMMDKNPMFSGTYAELIGNLIKYLGPKEVLPPTSHAISAELKRISPLLKRQRIHVYNGGRKTSGGSEGKGRSMVQIQKYELGQEIPDNFETLLAQIQEESSKQLG